MESKKRILVVDDEQEITLVLRSGLAKHGYDVRVAGEGEAALELFQAWPPDLVVTDLSMPNMNGLKLCQRLREISSVPIIVLSVKGDEATKVEALDAGADDYVTKPFGMGELLARVRASLRRGAPATEQATGGTDAVTLGLAAQPGPDEGGEGRPTPTEGAPAGGARRDPRPLGSPGA